MQNKTEISRKQPFLKKHWWGLLCTILFFVGGYHQCSTKIMPASKFGGPIYFGKVDKESVFIVAAADDHFRIFVSDGDNFAYSKDPGKTAGESIYPFTADKNTVRIIGLTPNLSEKEMTALWAADPVRVGEKEDGTITVSMGYDLPGQILSGAYKVNGDTVSGHQFRYGNALKGLVFIFGVIILYLSGKTVRGIIRFVRRRKQRHRTGSGK
jgi:hypothetical protein